MKKNSSAMITVLAVFIGTVVNCSISRTGARSFSPTDTPDFTITAESAMEPYKDLDKDNFNIKAPEKYAGKLVAVTGFVLNYEVGHLIVSPTQYGGNVVRSVQCEGYAINAENEVARNSKVKVMGIYDEAAQPYPFLKNCVVVEGDRSKNAKEIAATEHGREISATDNADFTMTSGQFLELTRKTDTTLYLGKVFDVSGRFCKVGNSPELRANAGDYLDIKMASAQGYNNLKEDELLKIKCVGIQKSSRLELANCLIIESNGIISAEGPPDFTITADEYEKYSEKVGAEYEKRSQNITDKYRNKVIDVTGKVMVIGGKGDQLVTSKSWLPCPPLAGRESEFQDLTDGAEVKFRGLSDFGLKHCIVISH